MNIADVYTDNVFDDNNLFVDIKFATSWEAAEYRRLDKLHVKHPERITMGNKSNFIRKWISANWPQLDGVSGVWIVGSTAYMLEQGNQPTGDLDLVCAAQHVLEYVTKLVNPVDTVHAITYYGGERVWDKALRQVDMWVLKEGQTIDDVILGFDANHPHARVAYEIATGKLTVYPNENV